jgi:hypothetical protein
MGAMDLMLGDDDDMLGAYQDLMMGARRRKRANVRARAGGRISAGALRQTLVPEVPGAPPFGARMDAMGLTPITFNSTSGTILTMRASPNKAFKGSRLILDIARTGATSTGAVSIQIFMIGQTNQFVSGDPVAAGAFSSVAVGTSMSLDPVTPGIAVFLNITISTAPTTTDTVVVTGSIIGLSYT